MFTNVTGEAIPDALNKSFDNQRRGMDYGYASDPFAYVAARYDKTRRKWYIFHEIYKVGLSNRSAVDLIKQENKLNLPITADSAGPKSIAEMRELGLRVTGARKGPDSVAYGIKWLQDAEEIIVDPVRCPNAYRELRQYELEPDR